MLLKHRMVYSSLLYLIVQKMYGQDIHYSQSFLNYPGQNPAHSGLYIGKHRITANYRNQWQSVPVDYMSLSIFYDTKFRFKGRGDQIGLGLGFDYDKAGDSELSLTSFHLSLNYGLKIHKSHRIILGLSPNLAQRRLSDDKLKWGNQWNGDRYDPNKSPKENYNLTGEFFVDLSGGVAYEFMKTNRTRFVIGGAYFHLLEPNQTFYDINKTLVKLPIRKIFHAQLNIGLGNYIDLCVNGQYQLQQEYEEKAGIGYFRIYLDKNPGVKLNLLTGCGLRLDDAFFPLIGFEYKDWLISASYDINTSDFKTATNQRGGLEFAIQYVFKSVEPVGIFRKCPIY